MFVVSFVGNNGTFIMGYRAMVMDVEFLYHLAYVLTSTLGLCVHELFYSILVHTTPHTDTPHTIFEVLHFYFVAVCVCVCIFMCVCVCGSCLT